MTTALLCPHPNLRKKNEKKKQNKKQKPQMVGQADRKRFVRNAQSQAHEQLDTWTNAWHDKNTL